MSSTVSAPSAAGTTTWAIDNSHTLVEFSVRHLMISTVKGRFGEVSGKVIANEADRRSRKST
jgi:polyisoprenoid-binding protein YceI